MKYSDFYKHLLKENIDDAYLQATKDNNLKLCQQMVDDAARKNGYNSEKMTHGSVNKNFKKFDKSFLGTNIGSRDSKYGFFFCFGDDEYAKNFAYKEGKYVGEIRYFYLSITNPYYYDNLGKAYQSDIFLSNILKIKQSNYDSLIILNVIWHFNNKIHDEVVVFEPNKIKLSDPITYDDNNQIIPLSSRFDKSNDDIRY